MCVCVCVCVCVGEGPSGSRIVGVEFEQRCPNSRYQLKTSMHVCKPPFPSPPIPGGACSSGSHGWQHPASSPPRRTRWASTSNRSPPGLGLVQFGLESTTPITPCPNPLPAPRCPPPKTHLLLYGPPLPLQPAAELALHRLAAQHRRHALLHVGRHAPLQLLSHQPRLQLSALAAVVAGRSAIRANAKSDKRSVYGMCASEFVEGGPGGSGRR